LTSIASYESANCRLSIEQPSARVVVIRLSGWDVGEFGDAPLRELEKALAGAGEIELFVDAREVRGASVDVSNGWAHWLKANRTSFKQVRMLTGSRFVRMTADFARRYAELNDIMTVQENAADFDAALQSASEGR
jgi:hypothetical protein